MNLLLDRSSNHINPRNRDEEIVRYVEKNYANPDMNLNTTSDVLGYHRNHVSRVVRRLTGVPFTTLLRNKRLEAAKDLLEKSTRSVAEIASDCGFSYAHHVIRVFHRSEGMTPGQFRKSRSEIHLSQ